VSRDIAVGADQSNHPIVRAKRLPWPIDHVGTVAQLAVSGPNYWHWMFDLLPRIVLLRRRAALDAIDAFVINPVEESFQRDTLAALGVPREKIVASHSALHMRAERLVVPSLAAYAPPAWATEQLRLALRVRRRLPHERRRLYISRRDADRRHVLNEEALLTPLRDRGFQCVTLRGRSVAEQLTLFGSAEIVVAPHGAGLTNLLFCRPRTSIVEILPPEFVNPVYWVISNHLDLRYFCAVGDGVCPPPPAPGSDPQRWFWSCATADGGVSKDIRVSTECVLALVDAALRGAAHTCEA
jgi:capsular polysaccharide biosynthesis protein